MIPALLGAILPSVFGIVDQAVEDKDEANKLKSKIQTMAIQGEFKALEAQASVVVAEANGQSAAQRNWRPHLMYLIMGLLVFNGVVVPLAEVFFVVKIPVLTAWAAIPPQMWTLLTTGLGGYIVGRSGEKMIKSWKDK